MRKERKILSTLLGAGLFFLTISVSVGFGIGIYNAVIQKTKNPFILVLVMLVAIGFLTLLATLIDYFRRKITVDRPVKDILQATDKISSGDFSIRLKVNHSYKKYNEFDFIKENLNKMTSELSKTEVLHQDFISNVSHELKTPLSIIQNYAISLQNPTLDENTKRNYTQTLVQTSKRLTELITNILKLNKLENQELSLEYEKIRLDEMLTESILSFEEFMENKSITLECDLEEIEMVTCPMYLEIVWNNLLSNAIKFSNTNGLIRVSLKRKLNKAIVQIEDHGCGISNEIGEHIFEKFYQGDTSHTQEGNGLGLALVKKVIDVMGGKITVESQVGIGTTFTVCLDLEQGGN